MPKPTVIVAEDQRTIREILHKILTLGGFDVIGSVGSGADVLALCATTTPDAVCLDIYMPGMDGFKTLREIRRLYPQVKVVMVSTESDDENIRWALDSGAHGYVVKPFNHTVVLDTLRKIVVQGREQTAEAPTDQ